MTDLNTQKTEKPEHGFCPLMSQCYVMPVQPGRIDSGQPQLATINGLTPCLAADCQFWDDTDGRCSVVTGFWSLFNINLQLDNINKNN